MSPLGVALPAAFALRVASFFPCLLAALRGGPLDRLAGLILAGPAATLVLLLLSLARRRFPGRRRPGQHDPPHLPGG